MAVVLARNRRSDRMANRQKETAPAKIVRRTRMRTAGDSEWFGLGLLLMAVLVIAKAIWEWKCPIDE